MPDGAAERIRQIFRANGWRVINLKYGRRLMDAFAQPHGERLKKRIDDMPNADYQALVRFPAQELRRRLATGGDGKVDKGLEVLLDRLSDGEVPQLLRDLGGHDLAAVLNALTEADAESDRPVVIVAYTHNTCGGPGRARRT